MHQKPDGEFGKMAGINPAIPQGIFQSRKPSGGVRPRHAADNKDEQSEEYPDAWEDDAPAEMEKRGQGESKVLLRNLAWSSETGVFNKSITAIVEADLPPGKENLTRVEITLYAMDPDGHKERIDSKETHLHKGRAKSELTLFYPQFKVDGELPKACKYVFTAKHKYSDPTDSPELDVASKAFCLEDVRNILETLEKEHGYDSAIQFASSMKYEAFCSLAKSGDKGNDPNSMPSRFFLLPGSEDGKIANLDAHPLDPNHVMSIANMRKALSALSFEVTKEGPFDAGLESALMRFLQSKDDGGSSKEKEYRVAKGDTLGEIARKHGLPGWKMLYEANKGAIGENPHRLAIGLVLKIPDSGVVRGQRLLRQYGADPKEYLGAPGYAYPWVLFSFSLEGSNEDPVILNGKKNWVLRTPERKEPIASGSMEGAGPFAHLVPAAGSAELEIASLHLQTLET